MRRVYLDASVIIAAILSAQGGSATLIKNSRFLNLAAITSQTVIDEIVAKKTKIKKSEEEIGKFISINNIIVRKRIPSPEIEPLKGLIDEEDAHLIAGAKLTKSFYLATLDKKHLLRPDIKKRFRYIKILTPGEILEELVS